MPEKRPDSAGRTVPDLPPLLRHRVRKHYRATRRAAPAIDHPQRRRATDSMTRLPVAPWPSESRAGLPGIPVDHSAGGSPESRLAVSYRVRRATAASCVRPGRDGRRVESGLWSDMFHACSAWCRTPVRRVRCDAPYPPPASGDAEGTTPVPPGSSCFHCSSRRRSTPQSSAFVSMFGFRTDYRMAGRRKPPLPRPQCGPTMCGCSPQTRPRLRRR